MKKKEVINWDVDDVEKFMSTLHLDILAPKFKEKGIDGKGLLQLNEEELEREYGCNDAQVRTPQLQQLGWRKFVWDSRPVYIEIASLDAGI